MHSHALLIDTMVNGFGVRGGRGRCYPFFEAFVACVNEAGNARGHKCTLQADDYKECLHHEKAVWVHMFVDCVRSMC